MSPLRFRERFYVSVDSGLALVSKSREGSEGSLQEECDATGTAVTPSQTRYLRFRLVHQPVMMRFWVLMRMMMTAPENTIL